MIGEIKKETEIALGLLEKSKLPIRTKTLIIQLTNEIQQMMDCGDWDFAVRLSYYRHEFAKTSKCLDWYGPFLEIRKARDKISILVNKEADDRGKRK